MPLESYRRAQRVDLERWDNGATSGIYRCDIETNAVNDDDGRETVYVGLYASGGVCVCVYVCVCVSVCVCTCVYMTLYSYIMILATSMGVASLQMTIKTTLSSQSQPFD